MNGCENYRTFCIRKCVDCDVGIRLIGDRYQTARDDLAARYVIE